MIADLLSRGLEVHPLYVRSGFRWESAELFWLKRLLKALASPALKPLSIAQVPMAGFLAGHWSVSGRVPGRRAADEKFYLPGRNLLLLAQAGVFSRLRGLDTIAMASLRGNPFPDATPAFRRRMQGAINAALAARLRIILPYRSFGKARVARKVPSFPMELTFSCADPRGRAPCGKCGKCRERDEALPAAR